MEPMSWIGLAIVLAVTAPMLVMAGFLLRGRGAWLIAGYNTASKEEKEKYDEKALCRFTGKILLATALCVPLMFLGAVLGWHWLIWTMTAAIVGLAVFAVIYCNTGNRFRK